MGRDYGEGGGGPAELRLGTYVPNMGSGRRDAAEASHDCRLDSVPQLLLQVVRGFPHDVVVLTRVEAATLIEVV